MLYNWSADVCAWLLMDAGAAGCATINFEDGGLLGRLVRSFPGLRDAIIGCGYAPVITILANHQLTWVEDARNEMTTFGSLFQAAPDSILKPSKSPVTTNEIKKALGPIMKGRVQESFVLKSTMTAWSRKGGKISELKESLSDETGNDAAE